MDRKMKKYFIAFMMPLLTLSVGYAQEKAEVAPVQQEVSDTPYWTDPTNGGKRLLNKSKFGDNWFVSLQAGGLYSWGTNISNSSFFDQVRPAAALSVGKWIAPAGGLRLQGSYGINSGYASNGGIYHWDAAGLALDGLFNFTNICCGYEEDRVFNLIGILGAGFEHTMDFSDKSWNTETQEQYFSTKSQNLLAIRLGLMANFRLSKAWDLNVEVINSVLDDSFDGWDGKGSNDRWDGHVNLMVGVTYRFKNHDGSHQFTYARRDLSKFDEANAEINRLREQKKVAPAPVTKVETEVVESNHVRSFISFDNASAEINKLQEVNVYTAAENLKKLAEGDLYISSTKEVKDAELFMARAQSIRNVLVNTYDIPAGRIFIEKNPAVINSLDPQTSCVIVYINE